MDFKKNALDKVNEEKITLKNYDSWLSILFKEDQKKRGLAWFKKDGEQYILDLLYIRNQIVIDNPILQAN